VNGASAPRRAAKGIEVGDEARADQEQTPQYQAMARAMRVSFAIVLTLVSFPAAAQQQIGTAHKVTPAAHGSMAGTLSAGAGVHADETIGTDKAGVASLRFQDQSNLDVGPRLQRQAQQICLRS
jgi:hypothetical protein